MDEVIRKQLEKLPRLHDHRFSQSCDVEARSRTIGEHYQDWLLGGRRASRNYCIEAIFKLGLGLEPRDAAPLLLFAVLSGRCDASIAIDKLQSCEDPAVSFIVHVLQHGADGFAENIRRVCMDDLQCCPAVVWLTNNAQSPFVEWLLTKHGLGTTTTEDATAASPDRQRIASLLGSLDGSATDIIDLLGIFDEATRCLCPWDREVYDLLRSTASAHGRRGQYDQQLTRLRQALSVAHRRHMAFGEEFRVDVLVDILQASTDLLATGKGSHDNVLYLGKHLALYTGGFPVIHLSMALALALQGSVVSAAFHLGAYRRAAATSEGDARNDTTRRWLDRVMCLLMEKGIDTGGRTTTQGQDDGRRKDADNDDDDCQ